MIDIYKHGRSTLFYSNGIGPNFKIKLNLKHQNLIGGIMKFLKIACVLAVALCLAGSVYAETQSVKVSGDLTMRGIYRNQYDYLSKGGNAEPSPAGVRTGNTQVDQSWFMSTAEVEIDADLTDNVQTVIRLVNQRDWNVYGYGAGYTNATALATNGRGGYTANADEFQVIVDLAYVTLKDFIYSPLTVTIGRQDLWFGKGFIVGANLQVPANTISAGEYTTVWSFDAIKAVLDYDPWTITAVYSKIFEDAIQANDDVDLWGVNVGYKFDSYKAEMEGYWFWKHSQDVLKFGATKNQNEVHNIGLRGSFDPIDVITLSAEGVYQCGQYVGSPVQNVNRDRSAWALDVSGELRYFTDKFSWKPKLGAEFIWYSGQEDEDAASAQGTYHGWDGMYRGKFDSAIREFVGKFYQTGRFPVAGNTSNQVVSSRDASFTNQYQMIFMGSIQPIESLNLKANYNLFWNQENYQQTDDKTKGFVGQEVDLTATWDYTEDVSFGLLMGWFVPGTVYDAGVGPNGSTNHVATDVVGTVKVSF